MVTNYSMLEYMLMRPMEHVFWHTTREWLESDDANRLLLVVDEAHLYQGAMGTEFSLLLNRMLSVLLPDLSTEAAREKLQFIITSASLGSNEDAGRDYARDLLSLNDQRRSDMVFPATQLLELSPAEGEDLKLNHEEAIHLANAAQRIKAGERRETVEIDCFRNIIGANETALILSQAEEKIANLNLSGAKARRHTMGMLVEAWPAAHRLRRLLLRRATLTEHQRRDLAEAYEQNPTALPPTGNVESTPLRSSLVLSFMFEQSAPPSSLDVLLDLIAAAKRADRRLPFMPLRAHLLVRGDTAERICPRCGALSSDGANRCACGAKFYTLYFDRNCGGTFLLLWLSSSSVDEYLSVEESLEYTPRLTDLFPSSTLAWPTRARNPTNGKDAFLGMLGQVLDDDGAMKQDANPTPDTLLLQLNVVDGNLSDFDPDRLTDERYVPVLLHCRGGLKRVDWEKEAGLAAPRECPYCDRTYAQNFDYPQFSDTETRGDQFFNSLVAKATSALDPVLQSRHAHRGRKMLLFSDGRQRAARLARDLKEAQAIDQGRAMFVHLHRKPWWSRMPAEHRTLERLYPHLCMSSATAGPIRSPTTPGSRSISHASAHVVALVPPQPSLFRRNG